MLAKLVSEIAVLGTVGNLAIDVTGIALDSRAVTPGNVFVACPGQKTDGRAYVQSAIASGAIAVVCEPPLPEGVAVPVVLVSSARAALASLAAAWYGFPSRAIGLVGVTGTDGKTTTTHLISAILNAAGIRTGLISTVAMQSGRGAEKNRTTQTTPEAPVIQQILAEMRDAGIQVGILEVSSHALETYRVCCCEFDCAVFTNLDPEHLDFHQSVQKYRAAKARLFAQLDAGSEKPWGHLAVVNREDPSSATMRAACHVPSIDFGFSAEASVRGEILQSTLDGVTFRVQIPEAVGLIRTRLAGRHNVLNWLGAIGAAHHFGASLHDVQRAASTFAGVPGRLEAIELGQPFRLYVDFAHTPQALDATLRLLRRHTSGRLIVLFGQAGHRDVGNRRRMADAVVANADAAIVTSDDPYDEDPRAIVDDIARWLRDSNWQEGHDYWRIVERAEAIEFAVRLAERGDCVLLAGRGPEDVTVVGGERIPLVDADVARAVLAHSSAA